MERLGEILAKRLYQSRRELKSLQLRYSSLTTDRLSALIILLFGIAPITLYFFISDENYTLTQIFASYLFVVLLFGLTIVLVIAWFKSEALFKNDLHGFSFVQLSSADIDTEFFGFDKGDVQNLLNLMSGLPVKQKIVIRETAKNKQSGNIRYVFTFLDLIVKEGIFRMDTKQKESLNVLISERFAFQDSDINPNTLPSSYSKWCFATQEGSYDEVRKDIAKALGIQ